MAEAVEGAANVEAPPAEAAINVRTPGDHDALAFLTRARESAVAISAQLAERTGQTAPAPTPTREAQAPVETPAEAGAEVVRAAPASLVELPDGSRIPLDKLVEHWSGGGLRQADYTQKTQALADNRRAAEAERQKLGAEARRLDGIIGQLEGALAAPRPSPQQEAEARATDPGEWAAQEVERQRISNNLHLARNARAQALDAAFRAQIPVEIEQLQAKEPEFKLPSGELNTALYNEVGKYAVEKLGYTPEQWNDEVKHPAVIAAFKGMRHDDRTRKTEQVGKRIASAPKILRPGGGSNDPAGQAQDGMKHAMDALARNPGNRDAIAATFLARSRETMAAIRAAGPRKSVS